jgi:hypothetical protein
MTRRRSISILTLALAAALVASTERVRSDDPVSSSVRFTGEIVRIFDRKCLPCHGSTSLAMPLSNYREVRSWGRAIREEIVEQRMPPWSVARGYSRFQNDLSLTARETTTVLSWIDGGMPRGDDRELPAPPPHPAPATAPDRRVALPPQRIPALEEHVVRRVSISMDVDGDRPIARVVLTPGARQVLRGALIFESDGDRMDRWVGAWLPWQRETAPPARSGFRLPRRARFTVELHYRGAEQDVVDESSVDVYYARESAQEIDELSVEGSAPARLARHATVWAIVPSAGETATSLELTARRPNGSVDVLLWIPELRREWPQALVLDRPMALPADTAVTLVTHPPNTSSRARLSLLR